MSYYVNYDPSTGKIHGSFRAEGNEHLRGEYLAVGQGVLGSEEAIDAGLYHAKGAVLTQKTEVELTVDKAEISADGVDQAVVTVSVTGEEPPASIDLLVAGSLETLNMSGGQGALDPITAETPCTVQVALVDTITYRGQPVEIEAVEHG